MSGSTTTFRAYTAIVAILVIVAGLALGGAALATYAVGAGAPKAAPIVWVFGGGGGLFVLLGIFFFGFALGREQKPVCPHCGRPVVVMVGTWSGKLQLDEG